MKVGSERNRYEQDELLGPSGSLWGRLAERIAAEGGWDPAVPAVRPLPESDWEEVALGISYQLIAMDRERDRISILVRLAPEAEYPPHRHAGIEELFLLYGELSIGDRKLQAGDYNRAEAGGQERVE